MTAVALIRGLVVCVWVLSGLARVAMQTWLRVAQLLGLQRSYSRGSKSGKVAEFLTPVPNEQAAVDSSIVVTNNSPWEDEANTVLARYDAIGSTPAQASSTQRPRRGRRILPPVAGRPRSSSPRVLEMQLDDRILAVLADQEGHSAARQVCELNSSVRVSPLALSKVSLCHHALQRQFREATLQAAFRAARTECSKVLGKWQAEASCILASERLQRKRLFGNGRDSGNHNSSSTRIPNKKIRQRSTKEKNAPKPQN